MWAGALVWLVLFQSTASAAQYTFFKDTQYPLTVHYLAGEAPGPTVMVQGGIQGDEPAGYLAAEILARSRVLRGNLIVVPRANPPSIAARTRQINVDLNRRFDQDYNRFYEDRLARAIRFVMAGADAFIHLHEGSGFYHPTYVDNLRNPNRYGQSVIIDASHCAEGRVHLSRAVESVLGQLNPTIVPASYRFQLFNTETFAQDTPYPEQRKSLTYFAMGILGIPALAIETSKHIAPLEWKVAQQVEATRRFLAHFGVEAHPPEVAGNPEAARSAPVLLSSDHPLPEGGALEAGLATPLALRLGQPAQGVVWTAHTPDRPGYDLLSGRRLPLYPVDEVRLMADGRHVKTLPVRWRGPKPSSTSPGDPPVFVCWLNDELRFVPEGHTLETTVGDRLVLEGVWGGGPGEVLNMKGFISNPAKNDGQDTGVEIILDPSSFLERYIKENGGVAKLRVVRETPGVRRAAFNVRVDERQLAFLKCLGAEGPRTVAWREGGTALLPPGDYRLADILGPQRGGQRDMLMTTLGSWPLDWGQTFTLKPGDRVDLSVHQATTFEPLGRMTLAAPNS